MKILVFCQYYYPEQFRINDICETLVNQGHSVTVITGLPNYPEGKLHKGYSWFRKRNENILGVDVIRVSILTRGKSFVKLSLNYISYMISASIRTFFLEKDFDVVYVYQLSPVTMAIPAIIYKNIHKRRLLLYCLDIWPESIAAAGVGDSSFFYKILLAISRKIYKSADNISVTSRSFEKYLIEKIGVNTERIIYSPQYAEDLFSAKETSYEEQEHSNEMNLLFAGNIGEMQSVETIVKAAAELKELKHIKWHIIGDGSARIRCEQLAIELGLKDTVIFYGKKPIEDMPQFYRKASAFLVTLSKNDQISFTLPGKVQSYLAFGKPLIGAIDGETRSVIEESGCGLCCAAEDFKGLSKIVKELDLNPAVLEKYSENSKLYYEEHFSKTIFMKKLINQFELIKGDE